MSIAVVFGAILMTQLASSIAETIDCSGKDQCKDSELQCSNYGECAVYCTGESACSGNTRIDASAASDVTVICGSIDSCKGNTEIECGTGHCSIQCTEETSCEDASIFASAASSFQCSGYCDSASIIPDTLTASPTGTISSGHGSPTSSRQPTRSPSSGKTQISCSKTDECKDKVLTCQSGRACTVYCTAESSCSGNTLIDASVATDVTVICGAVDACKGDTEIHCGTGLCSIACSEETSCEDASIFARSASSFQCSGYCDSTSIILAPLTASPSSQQSTSVGRVTEIWCSATDECKDEVITCQTGRACIVYCTAENSCSGNTHIDGSTATDVTVICSAADACKGNTEIECGTAHCSIHCEEETSCEDTSIFAGRATSFQCAGYCGVASSIPDEFTSCTPSTTTATTQNAVSAGLPTTAPSVLSGQDDLSTNVLGVSNEFMEFCIALAIVLAVVLFVAYCCCARKKKRDENVLEQPLLANDGQAAVPASSGIAPNMELALEVNQFAAPAGSLSTVEEE